jgi:hypothetical protein
MPNESLLIRICRSSKTFFSATAPQAIEQHQQALKLRPDFTPASNALARLRAGQ